MKKRNIDWSNKSETKDYHPHLIKKIEAMLPGCEVHKNDPNKTQGIEDLLILHNNKWATLEAKISEKARRTPEPNQEYYVKKHNDMAYASFIYPENEDVVLDELCNYFKK